VRVVLATSAPEEELKLARAVVDIEDHIHAVTSAEDVDQAKPDPGIVDIAQERAGCAPDRLIFVGMRLGTSSRPEGRAWKPSASSPAASRPTS
jgi:FMN phosphatase YigB (HAD superfamily)